MKICLISKEYPDECPGGIGSYTAGMAKALALAGHEVHVLSRSPSMARTYQDGPVTVHKLMPKILRSSLVRRYFDNLIYSIAVASAVRRLVRDKGVELVEAPEFAAEGFIYSILPCRPVPLVIRLHTPLKITEQLNQTKHSLGGALFVKLLNWMERSSILKADMVT